MRALTFTVLLSTLSLATAKKVTLTKTITDCSTITVTHTYGSSTTTETSTLPETTLATSTIESSSAAPNTTSSIITSTAPIVTSSALHYLNTTSVFVPTVTKSNKPVDVSTNTQVEVVTPPAVPETPVASVSVNAPGTQQTQYPANSASTRSISVVLGGSMALGAMAWGVLC